MKYIKNTFLINFVLLCAVCVFGQSTKQASQQTAKPNRPKLAIEYFAEYNIFDNKTGNSHKSDQSSPYNFNDAKYVCPNGWHLPTQEEWAGIFSYNANLQKGEEEPVSINGIKKRYYSEYKTNSDFPNIQYGIRFKRDPKMGFDNRFLSAYRYEYIEDAAGNKQMSVTVRYLGEAFKGGSMDDISNEDYWNKNKSDDIVRIFPFEKQVGWYWTSTSDPELLVAECPRQVFISGNNGSVTAICDKSDTYTRVALMNCFVRCIRDRE